MQGALPQAVVAYKLWENWSRWWEQWQGDMYLLPDIVVQPWQGMQLKLLKIEN